MSKFAASTIALIVALAGACDMPGTSDDGFCLRPEVITPDAVYPTTVVVDKGFFHGEAYLADASTIFKVKIPACGGASRVVVALQNREPGDPAQLAVTASADDGAATGGAPMRSGEQAIEIAVLDVVTVELGLMTQGAIFSGDVTITVLK